MEQTSWHGGRTGIEDMAAGYTSLKFTEVYQEVPLLYTSIGEVDEPAGGYYDPQYISDHGGDIANSHSTRIIYKSGTLIVRKDGVIVNHTDKGGGVFSIDSAEPGFIRVNYLPALPAIYFGSPSQFDYPQSPLRTRLALSSKIHINEVLTRLGEISQIVGSPIPRFSIDTMTGMPLALSIGIGVKTLTPLLSQLFTEISRYIAYLYLFAASLGANVAPPPIVEYNKQHAFASAIETFRDSINSLEAALDGLGL